VGPDIGGEVHEVPEVGGVYAVHEVWGLGPAGDRASNTPVSVFWSSGGNLSAQVATDPVLVGARDTATNGTAEKKKMVAKTKNVGPWPAARRRCELVSDDAANKW
jgi:hypothetical protein